MKMNKQASLRNELNTVYKFFVGTVSDAELKHNMKRSVLGFNKKHGVTIRPTQTVNDFLENKK